MGKKWIALLCLFAVLLTILPAGAESTGTEALPEEYAEYRLIARNSRYELYLYEPTISLLLRNTENGALIASTLNEHTAQGKLNKTWKGYTFSAFVLDVLTGSSKNYKQADLYTTRYVIWDNIGLPKQDRDIHSYESGAMLLEDAGLEHEGIIFDYQQSNDPDEDETYLSDQEALAYDMLYGRQYAYGGSEPYERIAMKMGHKSIKIRDLVKIGDRYYIRGENFTERSVISMDGKQLSTVYLSPTLLALNETIDPDDIDKLEVSQVDKSKETILTTVGANEEL